jgi:hypothetical protein
MSTASDPTLQYWHPMVNDEIGGWAVANYNTNATSKLNHKLGHHIMADCLTEAIARHIAKAHNDVLYRNIEHLARRYFDMVEVRVTRNDKTVVSRQVIPSGSPRLALENSIEQTAGSAVVHLREEWGA